MTSTQLLITQAAILVLLFGVVVWIVRSSARQIKTAMPPPLALQDPVEQRAMPASVPAAPPAPPVATPPPPMRQPVPVAVAATAVPSVAPANNTNTDPEVDDMGRSGSFDFDANLSPRLVIESGPGLIAGTELPLEGGLSIGRAASNGLAVDDAFISHMHARILRRGAFFYVEDLGSTNGTFVNDQRITGDAQLRVHDKLRLGETLLRYEE